MSSERWPSVTRTDAFKEKVIELCPYLFVLLILLHDLFAAQATLKGPSTTMQSQLAAICVGQTGVKGQGFSSRGWWHRLRAFENACAFWIPAY